MEESLNSAALEAIRQQALDRLLDAGRPVSTDVHANLIKSSAGASAPVNSTSPSKRTATSASDTNLNGNRLSANERRKRAQIDLNYCEYNFSTMKDTKGGFLIEETVPAELESSKRQKTTNEYDFNDDPFINLVNMEENPRCQECDSMSIDVLYLKHYKEMVCKSCREKLPDKYSLLTKTECKEDYLLTDSEMKDHDKMPCWEKPNPHKSTYARMQLFLRMHVEKFATEKWGSLEKLDEEFARREEEKKAKKEKKFKAKLLELRKKTRTSTWKKPNTEHVHEYGETEYDEEQG
ncbi:hypothetical protein HDV05_000553, partial [Chytridiales sp. JEL 0842]